MNPLKPTNSEMDSLQVAIRITNTQPIEHVSPDNCTRCSGYGCDECNDCQCPRKACQARRRGRR